MHELSLASEVIQILGDEASKHGLQRVSKYSLEVGLLRAVVPELLRTGLDVLSKGTVAEGAEVELREVPGRARCPACGLEFPVPDILIVCPGCEHLGGEILSGEELRLIELEGD